MHFLQKAYYGNSVHKKQQRKFCGKSWLKICGNIVKSSAAHR